MISKHERGIPKVKNPHTGRWITVGGSVYQSLQKAKVPLLSETIENIPPIVPPAGAGVSKSYPIDREPVSWKKKKPTSVGDRQRLLEQCGKSCFLLPKEKKFPICNKQLPCEYNCRGLKAASARAGQWKYTKVLEKSRQLTQKFGCYQR